MKPVAKHISFSKQKRPELWPVKDEHSRPAYQEDLNNCYRVQSSAWHKSAHLIQKEHREFQKERRTISPGPGGYIVPDDPSYKPAEHQRPLSGQQNFLDHKRHGNFPREPRTSFYSGNKKQYDDF